MKTVAKFQIGKFGVTSGNIEALKLVFKTHKQARISVLKASGRTRESMEKIASYIIKGLLAGEKARYEYRIIGFTIVMNKRKAR